MTSFVALLRAVNVGGTGKLAMSDLRTLCDALGLRAVRTFIASGNVVFQSDADAPQVKSALEAGLKAHAGASIGVLVRTAKEMAEIAAANPFPQAPGNRTTVFFLDEAPSPATEVEATGRADDELIALGRREIYVWYGRGMGASKLRIPATGLGTGRNMNTVRTLAEMAAD